MTRWSGPGYLFTMIAIAVATITWTIVDRPPRPRPIRAMSAASMATAARPTVAPRPTARNLLAYGEALGLTAGQRAKLETLAAAWERESASLQAGADAASAEFARFIGDAQKVGHVRLDEVQRRSMEVQELSAALRARRAPHNEEAAGVLTERQRSRLAEIHTTPGGTR